MKLFSILLPILVHRATAHRPLFIKPLVTHLVFRRNVATRQITQEQIQAPVSVLDGTCRPGVAVPNEIGKYGSPQIYHFPDRLLMLVYCPAINKASISCSIQAVAKAPILIVNIPRNYLVRRWEEDNFSTRFKNARAPHNYQRIQRAIRLDRKLDFERALATYHAGTVLSVEIPRTDDVKPLDALPQLLGVSETVDEPPLNEETSDTIKSTLRRRKKVELGMFYKEEEGWEFFWLRHPKYKEEDFMNEEMAAKAGIDFPPPDPPTISRWEREPRRNLKKTMVRLGRLKKKDAPPPGSPRAEFHWFNTKGAQFLERQRQKAIEAREGLSEEKKELMKKLLALERRR